MGVVFPDAALWWLPLASWTGRKHPLIGLYFALKDNEGLHDAAVWVLDPWRLNEYSIGKYEVLPPGSDGPFYHGYSQIQTLASRSGLTRSDV